MKKALLLRFKTFIMMIYSSQLNSQKFEEAESHKNKF